MTSKVTTLFSEVLDLLTYKDEYGNPIQCKNNKSNNRIDWNRINTVFRNICPAVKAAAVARLKDRNHKRNLLNWILCHKDVPYDVVEGILLASPSSPQERDIYGNNALHHALRNRASEDIIELLIQSCPNAVKVKAGGFASRTATTTNKHCEEKTALQIGLQNKASFHSVQLLYKTFPRAITAIDKKGKTVLYDALRNETSVDTFHFILNMLLQAVSSAKSSKKEKAVGREVAEIMLMASNTATKRNESPLHSLISKGASIEIFQLCLTVWPESIHISDKEYRSPLRYSIEQYGITSIDVIRLLSKSCPDKARVRDSSGQTPLHYALSLYALLQLQQQQQQQQAITSEKKDAAAAAAVVSNDNNNANPAAEPAQQQQKLLVLNTTTIEEIIELILDCCPDSAKVKGKDGMTALHYGIMYSASIRIFRKLLDAYPFSATIRDNSGNTALHYGMKKASGIGSGVQIGILRSIIHKCPDCVDIKDTEYNLTPLQYGMKFASSTPKEIIRSLLNHNKLFKKYRIDPKEKPTYQSDTCVVLTATTSSSKGGGGVRRIQQQQQQHNNKERRDDDDYNNSSNITTKTEEEEKVALKFLSNDIDFQREIEAQRHKIHYARKLDYNHISPEEYVVPFIKEAYTTSPDFAKSNISLVPSSSKRRNNNTSNQIQFVDSISKKISVYPNIQLSSKEATSTTTTNGTTDYNNSTQQQYNNDNNNPELSIIRHVLVMKYNDSPSKSIHAAAMNNEIMLPNTKTTFRHHKKNNNEEGRQQSNDDDDAIERQQQEKVNMIRRAEIITPNTTTTTTTEDTTGVYITKTDGDSGYEIVVNDHSYAKEIWSSYETVIEKQKKEVVPY